MNVAVYVNGKHVTKEEIGNIKIHSSVINKIVAEINDKRKETAVEK